MGSILVSDTLKHGVKRTVGELMKTGFTEAVIISGDSETAVTAVAHEVGIKRVFAGVLPHEKVRLLETIMAERKNDGRTVFAGDGMNNAPVLARADVGIAMGGIGSDAAVEAADIVIMNDDLNGIVEARRIAAKTKRLIGQNIALAIGIKAFFLILGAFGIATMWEAVIADVGVTMLTVLNSLRVLRTDRHGNTTAAS